MREYFMRFRLI